MTMFSYPQSPPNQSLDHARDASKVDSEYIGIDFGTTKTMVAEYHVLKKSAKVHRLGRAFLEIPSTIHTSESGEMFFGDAADDEWDSDPRGRIDRFKMKLGIADPSQFGRMTCTAADLTADFLGYVRGLLKERVIHHAVNRVVLTIPAMFGPAQQKDLTAAAERAGFKEVELLREPIAAGIAYCDHEGLDGRLRFLVVDWGGGTFDVALLERDEAGDIKVPRQFVRGLPGIGGEDLDDDFWQATSERLINEGCLALDARPNTLRGKYHRELKRTKEKLSEKTVVDLRLVAEDSRIEKLTWTRSDLEDVFSKKLRAGVSAVAELVEQCRKSKCPPEFILLAGGTSRIPLIQQLLGQATQIPCRSWSEGRDAIALGAAIYSHHLWGDNAIPSPLETKDSSANKSSAMSQYRRLLEVAFLDKKITNEERVFLGKERKALGLTLEESRSLQIQVLGAPIGDVIDRSEMAIKEIQGARESIVTAIHVHNIQARNDAQPVQAPDGITVSSGLDSVECPHCGSDVAGITGTGDWICQSCDGQISVGCSCPECGQEVEIEEWGTYMCPARKCGTEFDAADGITISPGLASVECPHCGNDVAGITGTGDWICPSCGGQVMIGCSCPECGEEVEIEEWGTYMCPARGCGTEFDAANQIGLDGNQPIRNLPEGERSILDTVVTKITDMWKSW